MQDPTDWLLIQKSPQFTEIHGYDMKRLTLRRAIHVKIIARMIYSIVDIVDVT